MTKKLFLFTKKFLFPGLDIGARSRMKFAKNFKPGDILTLDIGCGNGAFSFVATKLGNRVIGIDFDEEKLKRCLEFRDYLKIKPDQCDFMVLNAYNLLSIQKQFDQIICFETLEHIKDDKKIIELTTKVLKPGGVLHLCVPSANRKPYYGEIISEIEDGNHVRLGYTFETMEKMLEKVGLVVVGRDTAVGIVSQKLLSSINWIDINLFKNLPKRGNDVVHLIIFILLYPLSFIIKFLDRLLPSKPLNIYIAAKKVDAHLITTP